MNVLLFTTTMILILSSLTYARLEMYRNLSLLQAQFNHYMMNTERATINNQAIIWYKSSPATKKAGKESQQKGKRVALSRLSFAAFVDSKKQEAYQEEYPQLFELAKKLFAVLYKDQPFYQAMKQKRPDFEEALLKSLKLAEELPKDQKLTRAADLSNLNLQDSDLNEIFYKMLQPTSKSVKTDQQECPQKEGGGEEEDDAIEPGKKEEKYSPADSYSLLDFITLQDAAKVRVYLAPKPLLLALFDDPHTVNALIEMRCHLYNSLINGTITADQATKTFQTQFLSQSREFNEKVLDFTVSKTNPRNYE